MAGSLGFFATLDGIIPFGDPFENYYANGDGSVDAVYGWSKFFGSVSRDAALMAAVPNISAWARNPIMYELGSTTIPAKLFASLSHLTPVARGQAIFRQLGWGGFGLNRLATASDWSATVWHWSGLTPGGNLAVIAGVDVLDRVFESLD